MNVSVPLVLGLGVYYCLSLKYFFTFFSLNSCSVFGSPFPTHAGSRSPLYALSAPCSGAQLGFHIAESLIASPPVLQARGE